MSRMEEEEKEALFDELYQLDNEDSEEDQSNASVILRHSRLPLPRSDVWARAPRNRAIHCFRPEQSLLRTVSAPLADTAEKSSFSSITSSRPSEQVIVDTPIIVKKSAAMTTQKEASKTTGKRKRGQSLELKPESQQIFIGLAFCRSHGVKPAIKP